VVLRNGEKVTVDELRAYCKQRLAAYKVPKQVEFCASLPKSAVGKVLRRELRQAEAPRQATPVEGRPRLEQMGRLEPLAAG
jgi:long-chain acyl-CoA synthetase